VPAAVSDAGLVGAFIGRFDNHVANVVDQVDIVAVAAAHGVRAGGAGQRIIGRGDDIAGNRHRCTGYRRDGFNQAGKRARIRAVVTGLIAVAAQKFNINFLYCVYIVGIVRVSLGG
jgi:hypothetical protein